MTAQAQSETRSFDAEVTQLLDLVAHSLYSNKEVFLRELISNSSDAADKLRYAALTDSALYENDSELKIWVDVDAENKTVTLRDNGIGMTRDEVVENLGTIARSGTKAFKEMIKAKEENSELIGQFGVGFYSAFIVSDKVSVRTRRAGMNADQGVYWESDGKGEYSIKNIDKADRGTEIVLHINEDSAEYLDETRLRTIITKYSDHILLPIVMKKPISAEEKEKAGEDEIIVPEDEVVNQANALWTKSKSEIKDEEYCALYKHVSHDFEDPLAWAHNKVEGSSEYTSLLFIPARAPFDLYNRDQQRGLKLYVKRVFIMDDVEQFMPMYLRFVKGIIDTSDMPLNVSREILQSNKSIDRIRSGCVKRVLGMLENMQKNDPTKYSKFWKEFGQVLKEGPAEDFANRDRIAKLLMFSTTENNSSEPTSTLADYVERMKEGQDKIYYITADSHTAASNSPLLEVFRKKGIEVVLLSDRVDEWLVGHLTEFDGKPLQSVAKGEIDLGDLDDEETKEQQKQAEEAHADFVTELKELLKDRVEDVRLTHRLTDSPCCVVSSEQGMSNHMLRMLKAAGQEMDMAKPILEINPDHVIIERVKALDDKDKLSRWANILLGQALLAEGESLGDPAAFVKELNQLLMG